MSVEKLKLFACYFLAHDAAACVTGVLHMCIIGVGVIVLVWFSDGRSHGNVT